MAIHPFSAYTAAVCSFAMKPPGKGRAASDLQKAAPYSPIQTAKARRALERTGKRRWLLLGLGHGTLVRDLATGLPTGHELAVCTLDTDGARALLQEEGTLMSYSVLADTSIWALLLLLHRHGWAAADCATFVHPACPPAEAEELKRLQRRFAALHEELLPGPDSSPASAPEALTLAAILRPDEPHQAAFLAQAPAWLHEVVCVWDGASVPDRAPEQTVTGVAVRHIARPLGLDFAAQRNAMLGACTGEWVLYLDGDERLAPATWATLPHCLAMDGAAAFHFPRLTFHPDEDHVRAGFGLWPDLQLRLFRNAPGLRFEGRIHERLVGVSDAIRILPGMPIEHHAHLWRTDQSMAEKLALFNEAARANGDNHLHHALSEDYPSPPRELLHGAAGGGPCCLVLPPSL